MACSWTPVNLGRTGLKVVPLGLDHTDVLLLGWWNRPPPERVLTGAAELVRRGRARHLMISCHRRPTFPLLARDPRAGLLMMRYNAAHPGAERGVFPHLPEERPGVVAYTTTSWGQLIDPALAPAGERVPRGTDCYRCVVSNPLHAGARAPSQPSRRSLRLAGRLDELHLELDPDLVAHQDPARL